MTELSLNRENQVGEAIAGLVSLCCEPFKVWRHGGAYPRAQSLGG